MRAHRSLPKNDQAPNGLTHAQQRAAFRSVMDKAVDRWQDEAAREHSFLLNEIRQKLSSVDGIQPSHIDHVETCIQVLSDALRTPTAHLDLSLLPLGHALSDGDLLMFAQRRALMQPPLKSITLPARCTHLPEYLAVFTHLTHVHCPEFAGTLDELGMQPHWHAIQLGYFQECDLPSRSGMAQGEPQPEAPSQLVLILRPAADDLHQQSFSHAAMRFVRQYPSGTRERHTAVELASRLIHTVQWHAAALDLSPFEPSLLQRAANHGLFTAFDSAHGTPSAHAVQSAHHGTTRYEMASVPSLSLVLPEDLQSLPTWITEFTGLRVLHVQNLPVHAFNAALCPGIEELHINGQAAPLLTPPGCQVHWHS